MAAQSKLNLLPENKSLSVTHVKRHLRVGIYSIIFTELVNVSDFGKTCCFCLLSYKMFFSTLLHPLCLYGICQ